MTRARAAEGHSRALSFLRLSVGGRGGESCSERTSSASASASASTSSSLSSSSSPSSRFGAVASAHDRTLRAQSDALRFALSVAEGEAALAEGEVAEFAEAEERVSCCFSLFFFFEIPLSLSVVFCFRSLFFLQLQKPS